MKHHIMMVRRCEVLAQKCLPQRNSSIVCVCVCSAQIGVEMQDTSEVKFEMFIDNDMAEKFFHGRVPWPRVPWLSHPPDGMAVPRAGPYSL